MTFTGVHRGKLQLVSRQALLQQMLDRKLKVRFSCVDTRWLNGGRIGRELDGQAIAELRVIRQQTGLDLCGEEDEYHTLVTDGPQFTRAIKIPSYWALLRAAYFELSRRLSRGGNRS